MQLRKIALLNIIFQCDLEKIKENILEFDLDLKNIDMSNTYDVNFIISFNSKQNIYSISNYLYHYSTLEKYLLCLGDTMNIKENNSMRIFKELSDKYSLFNLNSIQLEKLYLYREIRNFISHSSYNEVKIKKINSTYKKLFKNNNFIINKFSEIEMKVSFFTTFINEIEIMFISNPINNFF